MLYSALKNALRRFRKDERGTIMVETVIALPLLVWALAASYEFFEVHRYMSARDKATYTIADMFSREVSSINTAYMDNTKILFDEISNDQGVNQIRVSIIKFDEETNSYSISWSEVRGIGDFIALTSADVAQAFNELPIMNDGEELILVESQSTYQPLFNVGLTDNLSIDTRVFTSPRFSPQICWETQACG